MSEDACFGPWIAHDGKGCPCLGSYVMVDAEMHDGQRVIAQGVARSTSRIWHWAHFGTVGVLDGQIGRWGRVLRYRIRRPPSHAFTMLSRIAAHPDRFPVTTPLREVTRPARERALVFIHPRARLSSLPSAAGGLASSSLGQAATLSAAGSGPFSSSGNACTAGGRARDPLPHKLARRFGVGPF